MTVTGEVRIGALVKEGSAGANAGHPMPLFFNGVEGAGVLAGRGAASFFL
jgi:hypothetical protein